jgi:hypothetical protein
VDTNAFEFEQKAAAPADLLQQEPHVEVVDSKSSLDLSDDDRLAAGVSKTRLQTKRLSGAQWKRLTRESKVKGRTWTDKKPPRKTPSSQEVGAVGSSEGVRRLHPDSSTPSSENSNKKNPGTLKCKLGRTRKLLLASRLRLFTDVVLMSNWIMIRLT